MYRFVLAAAAAFRRCGVSPPNDQETEQAQFGMEPIRVTPDLYRQKQKQGEVAAIAVLAVGIWIQQGA